MSRYFLIITLLMIPLSIRAGQFCPESNPADVDNTIEINEQEKRRFLLCSCGTLNGDGEYVLQDAESIRRYLILVNNDFLARYDANCNLEFDRSEQDKYVADQSRVGRKLFAKAVSATEERTAYSKSQLERRMDRTGETVPSSVAIDILPDSEPRKAELSASFVLEDTAFQETENFSLGYKFFEKPWRSPTTNSHLSIGLEIDASRKQVATSLNETLTRSIDFFPVNYKVTPIEEFTFSVAAGATYLFTDETVFDAGVKTKIKDVAFVYKLGMTYQTLLPCLSIGVDYKIRTGKFTGNKLSDEWAPKVVFDFLKSCSPE